MSYSKLFPFSDDRIESFSERPAPRKRLYIWDEKEPGLGLAVTSNGVKSFICRVRFYGTSPRVTIGRFPQVDVDRARRDARAIKVAADNGVDPRDALQLAGTRKATGITVGEFWEVYGREYGQGNLKKWRVYEREFEKYWGPIQVVPMNNLTADQIRRWYRTIAVKHGEHTAEAQINRLRAIYNKAMALRDADGRPYAKSNPAVASMVQRVAARTKRDRYLKSKELRRLFEVLSDYEPAFARHAILLALYTGARHSNVAGMRFRDIDFENEIWLIPKEHFKSQSRTPKSHAVPLVKQAMRILHLRREFYAGTWVFPSRRGKDQPTYNFTDHWHQVRKKAKIEDVVFHDLRRTVGSWMAMTNSSQPIIAQFLGHTSPGATPIYMQLAVGPVREAAQKAVDTMHKEGGVDE